jgi:RNA polymerase sigma factor (sigma-70 family)
MKMIPAGNNISLRQEPYYLNQLKDGQESGLNHFYKKLYPKLVWWALKRVKDDVAASSITHEAFLKLWLLRGKMDDSAKLRAVLESQIHQGCEDFYQKSANRFHRSMIKLDDIENYQEFMGGYNPEDDPEEPDTIGQFELDEEKRLQWHQVEKVMPSLQRDQQLFIKLCLRFAFNYERIAWHLGGISDYQVAKKVEQTIETLRNIIGNGNKLTVAGRSSHFLFEGEISEEQAGILNMRYEMQFSFEEIAAELGLSQSHVQKVFVQARLAVNKVKKAN